jgi:hypothetical protein
MPHFSTEEVEDAVSTAFSFRLPEVVDNVYLSTPLFRLLDIEERIVAQGGTRIEAPFIYAKPPGGSYSGMDTLDITRRKTKSLIQLDWKQYYATVTIDGITYLKAGGEEAIFDLCDVELQAAELRMKEDLGTDIFLDGTGNNSKALDGMDIAFGTSGTYGGISRTTDTEGAAIKGVLDATGGPLTLPAVQSVWGSCTIGTEAPKLIITTQAIFDAFWARLQPQQRGAMGADAEQLAAAGFNVITFNGRPVTVDQKCPSGMIYLVNTSFCKLIPFAQRADIEVEGPLTPTQHDARTWRLLWAGNFCVNSPRLNGRMSGIT